MSVSLMKPAHGRTSCSLAGCLITDYITWLYRRNNRGFGRIPLICAAITRISDGPSQHNQVILEEFGLVYCVWKRVYYALKDAKFVINFLTAGLYDQKVRQIINLTKISVSKDNISSPVQQHYVTENTLQYSRCCKSDRPRHKYLINMDQLIMVQRASLYLKVVEFVSFSYCFINDLHKGEKLMRH